MQDMPYRRPLLSLILSPSRSRYIYGSCKKIRQRSLQPHGRQYFVPIQITESINLRHSGESLQNKNKRKKWRQKKSEATLYVKILKRIEYKINIRNVHLNPYSSPKLYKLSIVREPEGESFKIIDFRVYF